MLNICTSYRTVSCRKVTTQRNSEIIQTCLGYILWRPSPLATEVLAHQHTPI